MSSTSFIFVTDHVKFDTLLTLPKKYTHSKSEVQNLNSLDKSGRLIPEGGERPV